MSKKSNNWNKKQFSLKAVVVTGIIAFVVGIIASYGTMFMSAYSSGSNGKSNKDGLAKFSTIYRTLNNSYYKKLNSSKLINGGIDGMIATLNDPYTEYINDNVEDFDNDVSGNISGIGATVTRNSKGLVVVNTIKNSPARKAGIKKNDQIIKINGKSTKNMTISDATNKIKGKTGTTVTVTFKRDDKVFTKKLKRQQINVSSVTYHVSKEDKNVGYIQISEFTDNTTKDLISSIKALNKKKVTRLVIDLRGNPGGLMDQAILSSSIFLKNGDTIMSTKEKDKKATVYKSKSSDNNGFKYKKHVTLLTDNGTASAAEIFTAALSENNHAPIVGMKTFGKGVVQTIIRLDGHSELKYTTAKWLTPKGHWINHKGIKPTYEVKYPKNSYIANFTSSKTYKPGQSGSDVKVAQNALKQLGYDVDTTGTNDEKTSRALADFQKRNSIKPSGNLDKQTREAIMISVTKKIDKNDPMYDKALTLK